LAPPPSAQQQAPLRAAIALPQTRSPLPANGVSPAMPNMGEHLPSSSPASHAAGSSSSASYSRELLGSAPQQQLEQAASRPSTASQTRPRARGSQFAAEPNSTAPPPGFKPPNTVQAQGSAAVHAVSSTAAVADHTPPGYGPQRTLTDQSQHSLTPAASSSRATASPGVRQDPPPASQRLPYSTHPALSGTDDYPPGFTHPSAPMTQAQPSNADDVAAVMPAKSSVQHPRTHSLSSSEPANSSQQYIVLPIPISAKTPSSSVCSSSQAGAAALSPAASVSTSNTSHDLPPGFASDTKAAACQPAADVPQALHSHRAYPPDVHRHRASPQEAAAGRKGLLHLLLSKALQASHVKGHLTCLQASGLQASLAAMLLTAQATAAGRTLLLRCQQGIRHHQRQVLCKERPQHSSNGETKARHQSLLLSRVQTPGLLYPPRCQDCRRLEGLNSHLAFQQLPQKLRW